MGTRVILRVHGACFAVLACSGAHSQPIPPAYQTAARIQGVPAAVLFAVAIQESGQRVRGRLIPWPWTLNIAGTSQRYARGDEACEALRRALARVPAKRIDVGLGQINVGFHGARVEQPCALLDPYRNLALTAAILREQHAPGDDWLIAVGRYHRPAGGEAAARYRKAVQQHLDRVVRVSLTPPSHPARPKIQSAAR